jgi:fusarinine C synthase
MGSIQVDDTQGRDQPRIDQIGGPSVSQTNGDGFRSLKVLGLASDQTSTPTGMRDEILLLSWLIVLLRTREDGQISCDWAYKVRESVLEDEPVNIRLSTDEVMADLQSTVGQAAAKISRHIATVAPRPCTAFSDPVSLVLSTGPLSLTSEGAKDEVSQ